MAKRFTDTEIWKKQKWFKSLSPVNKLLFLYIKDNCDHAGMWKVDAVQIMEDIGIDDVQLHDFVDGCNIDHDPFTGKQTERQRIQIVNNTHLWITGFIQFQYANKNDGKINPKIPAIKSALNVLKGFDLLNEALEKHFITLSEPLETPSNPSQGVKDKDKDSIVLNKKEENSESRKPTKKQIQQIYELYPRKVGKKEALKKIEIALREINFDEMCRIVSLYAECVKNKDPDYVPYPATWFNKGRYLDDPKEWKSKEEAETKIEYGVM